MQQCQLELDAEFTRSAQAHSYHFILEIRPNTKA